MCALKHIDLQHTYITACTHTHTNIHIYTHQHVQVGKVFYLDTYFGVLRNGDRYCVHAYARIYTNTRTHTLASRSFAFWNMKYIIPLLILFLFGCQKTIDLNREPSDLRKMSGEFVVKFKNGQRPKNFKRLQNLKVKYFLINILFKTFWFRYVILIL